MNSLKIKLHIHLLLYLTIFLLGNSLYANTFSNCDDFTLLSNPEKEAIEIIKVLKKASFTEKVANDSLIDALICLAKNTDDDFVQLNTLIIRGERHFENSEFIQAKAIFQKVLERENVHPENIAAAHNYIALIYRIEGKLLEAYKHNLVQLKISQQYNLASLPKTYLSLGEFHYHINDYEKAENLYLRGVELEDSTNNMTVEHGWLLHRLGEVYRAQNKNELSHFYIKRAINFWKKTDNIRAYCFSINQHALLYMGEDKNQKALDLINEVYTISQNENLWFCHIQILLTLSEIHYKMGNITLSIQHLERASFLSTEKSIFCYSEEIYELQAKAYKAIGQTKKSNEAYQNFIKEIKKSKEQENIATKEWAKKNQDLLLSKKSLLELEEKERFANKQMTFQRILLFGGLIIIFLISWLATRYFKANKEVLRQQSQLIKLNKTIQKQSHQLQEANTKILYKNNGLELELVKKLLILSKQGEAIHNMENQLKTMGDTRDNQVLTKQINIAKNDTVWEELDLQINQANSELFQILSQKFENLSKNDLRLCAFLKMNMSTKEIANLTFKNPASVKVARSRLRKKLGITHSNMTISTFLNRL